MVSLNVATLTGQELQRLLQSVIAPRPICFASTLNHKGEVNLSPFSFFNLFSIQPPVCVFSPSRRLRDNSTKHTLENIKEVDECVINIVTYDMVGQTSLASCDFPRGVNEFEKAGFTMLPSEVVKPPRVAESPVQLECKVRQVVELGQQAGSGNLVVAEVLKIHLAEKILDEKGQVDQRLMDLVARLGGNWYARITPEALFEWEKPNDKIGVGFDALPEVIRASDWLTENEKSRFANLNVLPDKNKAMPLLDAEHQNLIATRVEGWELKVREEVIQMLRNGKVQEAYRLAVQLT
ncbi:MAG: flavin reductase family protein [Bacteroidetes bacterium]|nr:flavin reductase family protein [Bacteroidota bacterium]